jgi:RimJ/RimL family protein N-acetyltransferase
MDVRLRPVEEKDLDVFEEHATTPEGTGELQWFGHRSQHDRQREFADNGLLGPEGGYLTVEADGQAAGWMRWQQRLWGPPQTSWCWTISIVVFPGFRGQGVGSRAQRGLVDYLFAHTRAERIEASTDATNVAEQRALEKSGFEREGVIRRGQWRDGGWHDQVMYSILRP